MIDETMDITNQEQVTIVMRRIEDDFEVYEESLGLYAVPCSTMSGIRSCVAKRVQDEEYELYLLML